MNQIQVCVFASKEAQRNNVRLFEVIISKPSACRIPYDGITDTLRFFYGNNVIITFSISAV